MQAMREKERQEMESRGLVDKQDVRKKLQDAITFVGSCTDMCPIFERVRRTYENNVKQLEKDPITGKVTSQYAVKAFSRPAAGQPPPLPSDVRPPHILVSTLRYLTDKILPQLPASHSFLWDRTRSIRQDFTYQNYSGPEAIECNEQIARIHVICLHVMAGSEQEYSKQQEIEQLTKTLQTLSEFYNDNRKKGHPDSPNEPEMRAFQLLSHLRDPDIEFQIQQLPIHVFKDPRIQVALELRNLVQQNRIIDKGHIYSEDTSNLFALFFQNLSCDMSIPPLYLCLLESSFNDIRLASLNAMSRAYHARGKPYFIDRLTSMLGFDNDSETLEFCQYYELKISDDSSGKKCVDLVSYNSTKINEKQPKSQPFSRLVDRRVGDKFNQLVWPGELPVIKPKFDGTISSVGTTSFGSIMNNSSKLPPTANATNQPFSFGNTSVPKSETAGFPVVALPVVEKKPTWANIAGGTSTFNFFGNNDSITTGKRGFGEGQPSLNIQQRPPSIINQSTAPSIKTSNIFPVPIRATADSLPPLNISKSTSAPSSTSTATTTTTGGFINPFANTNNISVESSVPKPLSTSTPSPRAQSPAPPPKPIYTESMISKQYDKMLRQAISIELTTKVLPQKWSSILQARNQRQSLIDKVSNDIYSDMVSKLLYRQSAEALAEHIDSKRTILKAIRLIIETGRLSKQRVDIKRKRREEYELVSQLLGRGHVRRSSSNHSLRNTSVLEIPTPKPLSQKDQIEIIRKARDVASSVWAPLETKSILIPPIEDAFRKQLQFDRTVSLAVFCNDWESTVGSWVRRKLSLEWDGKPTTTYSSSVETNSTRVDITALQDDPNSYSKIGMIVFECGLEPAIERDALDAVLSSVIPRSYFQVSVLIVNWDSRSQSEVFDNLQIQRYEERVAKVIWCPLLSQDGADTSINFSLGLENLARSFTASLSELGLNIQRQNSLSKENALAINKGKREREYLAKLESQKQQKWNRISSMNSLHAFDRASSADSPKRKRSFNDHDHKIIVKSVKSPTGPRVPKALAELKDLVSSVLNRPPETI